MTVVEGPGMLGAMWIDRIEVEFTSGERERESVEL